MTSSKSPARKAASAMIAKIRDSLGALDCPLFPAARIGGRMIPATGGKPYVGREALSSGGMISTSAASRFGRDGMAAFEAATRCEEIRTRVEACFPIAEGLALAVFGRPGRPRRVA